MSVPIIRLHPQKHRRVQGGHPWVYSNEIVMDAEAKALPRGTIVGFYAHDKKFLGMGSFNANCLIAGRVFTPHLVDDIGEDWLAEKIADALRLREKIIGAPFYRLIHAEADGLPGLIIDRFDDVLCVQLNTAGMDMFWPALEAALNRVLNPRSIILRNDSFAWEMEGLLRETKMIGAAVEASTIVRENGLNSFCRFAGRAKNRMGFPSAR